MADAGWMTSGERCVAKDETERLFVYDDPEMYSALNLKQPLGIQSIVNLHTQFWMS